MALNYPMKFYFAAFMGFSQEFHGIFIKLWFIVYRAIHWINLHAADGYNLGKPIALSSG